MDNPKIRRYLYTWAALLLLLGANLAGAALPGFPASAHFGIALAQVLLLVAVFMELREDDTLLRLAAGIGFFCLLLLFGLTFSDYLSRGADIATARIAYPASPSP